MVKTDKEILTDFMKIYHFPNDSRKVVKGLTSYSWYKLAIRLQGLKTEIEKLINNIWEKKIWTEKHF